MSTPNLFYNKTPQAERIILNCKIDARLMRDFKLAIFNKHGMQKGNIRNAIEEALRLYIIHNKVNK